MKKFFKKISFFVLMILLLLPISSCANAGFDEDSTPIEWGFNTVSGGGNDDGEPDIAFACAFKTEKTVFDINNVYVEFFYGHNSKRKTPRYCDSITANILIVLGNETYHGYHIFSEKDPNVIMIKSVNDYLTNYDNYSWNYFHTPQFLHSEIVKIPKDAFKSDKGKIRLAFNYWYELTDKPGVFYSEYETCGINYQVKGNTVKLSADSI